MRFAVKRYPHKHPVEVLLGGGQAAPRSAYAWVTVEQLERGYGSPELFLALVRALAKRAGVSPRAVAYCIDEDPAERQHLLGLLGVSKLTL